MNRSDNSLQQLNFNLALIISTLIALVIPVAFFLLSYQGFKSTLTAQAELSAHSVTNIIQDNPKTWHFEEHRLSELLERQAFDGVEQSAQIIAADGSVLADNHITLPAPVATVSHNLYDSGTTTGRIVLSRSLRPILGNSALIALFSTVASVITFILFQKLPLRAVRKAFTTLEESEKRYRSLYETMKEGMALHQITYDNEGACSALTVIDINSSFQAMFDNYQDEIVGRDSFELFGDTFREYISERFMILEQGDTISFELQLPGNGNYYDIQAFSPDLGLIATLLEDITESRKSELQIQQMAYFDTLTGLPNRALFYDRMNQAIANATREKSTLAVFFLDLDHFKHINDTLGHSAGDQLLIECAQRLNGHVRTSDTLARLGGDEFVVVQRLSAQLNATHIAQKLIDSLQAPFTIQSNVLYISTSIGIALFPEDGTNAETLIKHADMAMYSSKESGRNTYNFFSPVMNQNALKRMENETGLRHALERNEFFLEFQPIVSVTTGIVVAAEALVRWNHPTRGRIEPTEFIALAEETGMIVTLGEWVLRSVCTIMKTFNDAALPKVRFCVNVSSRQIEQQNFPETVRTVLQETAANAAQLEIELTESCLVTHIDKSISDVFGMRDWGITIAIDDFGTGYSSLSYIKTLPIDHIKIDRAFVTDICTNVQDQAIVEAIITMSKKLGINNIAEGVETVEQLEFLKAHECSEIQGYYFHKPLSVEDFETLLRTQSNQNAS
jgi:diguanylate cyclase (GGDEF)-like protein